MECAQFEELISDYLECGLARSIRRSFCEHLLACRPCHLLFNDVREVIDTCHLLKEPPAQEIELLTAVKQRIIKATTAGEMLSCRTLDALILDYFEGLIENTYEKIFTEHFAACESCSRLVEGVRESIEEKEAVDVPEELNDRIIAATVGARR